MTRPSTRRRWIGYHTRENVFRVPCRCPWESLRHQAKQPDMGQGKTSGDVLGEVYQDSWGSSPVPRAGKGAVLHPCPQGETLVALLAPHKGRVYDPCCGSGGMFVQSEQFVEHHGGWRDDISIYGQESTPPLGGWQP